MINTNQYSAWVREASVKHGFDQCGIAKAEILNEDAARLEKWLKQGMHGSMGYMEKHFDLRIDPSLLVPGARSVITLLKNYYPGSSGKADLKISKYAYGNDYHQVIKGHLQNMIIDLQEKIGQFHGRGFVDSAPVLERSWAQKSGLGWIGKNGNLINRQSGSFFFIATLIVDVELDYDVPFATDHCGTCTRCIDSCPTAAILPDKTINGSQCISYFTIELKDEIIPKEMKGKFQNWMFGCDVCQDVCPWNRFSKPHQEVQFHPSHEILNLSTREWEDMSEETFQKLFRHSPLRRSKFSGIKRNIRFLKQEHTISAPGKEL